MCIKTIFRGRKRSGSKGQTGDSGKISPVTLVHLFNDEAAKIDPRSAPSENELRQLLEQCVNDSQQSLNPEQIDFSGLDSMQRWKKKACMNATTLLFPILDATLERPVEVSELKAKLSHQSFPFPDCLRFIGIEKTGVSGLAYTALGPANMRLLVLGLSKYRDRPLGWSPEAEAFIRAVQEPPEMQFYFVNPVYRQLVRGALQKYHELIDPR